MQANHLRIHRFEPASLTNGPGKRAVLWVQGCALGCPGCFNPETHSFDGGQVQPVESVLEMILAAKDGLEGLTISGGEPLHQHRALAHLFKTVKTQTNLSVLVFTGYSWEEIQKMPRVDEFLAQVDVLIAGRYQADQRVAQGLIGSANKVVHCLTNRYTPQDLDQVPQAEVIITPDGEILLSGIDPLNWNKD